MKHATEKYYFKKYYFVFSDMINLLLPQRSVGVGDQHRGLSIVYRTIDILYNKKMVYLVAKPKYNNQQLTLSCGRLLNQLKLISDLGIPHFGPRSKIPRMVVCYFFLITRTSFVNVFLFVFVSYSHGVVRNIHQGAPRATS